ncbi:uncharacterized protein LOC130735973 [Lotus japonicus]|uniref:uncharacterized protein LOC130735973 n=1 Tax=Lotus japonicus TaxID=34305 RepID=UPI002583000C|nr:uncharacterized protein LOC130735973 [Lotus japonicus]
MESIKIFLKNPPKDDDLNTRAKHREASFYTLVDGELYRRGIMSPMLKCIDTRDALGIMTKVHEVAKAQMKFIIVAVDYFTEWIEAEAVAAIITAKVRNFLWRRIVCRFGVPMALVMDNGTQFTSNVTREFCAEMGIEIRFASVEHPQTNGQAESANKVILKGLKKKLDEAKGL